MKIKLYQISLFDEANVIKSLEFTPDNYEVTCKSICERYDNPRMLVHNHLKSIFDFETLSNESGQVKLHKINDTSFKHIAALKSLATESDLFDTFLVFGKS